MRAVSCAWGLSLLCSARAGLLGVGEFVVSLGELHVAIYSMVVNQEFYREGAHPTHCIRLRHQ